MDWDRAIDRNRAALARIVAGLLAMAGLAAGDTVERMPLVLRRTILAVLRPAESAVRRLIVMAAHGLAVKLPQHRPLPAGLVPATPAGPPKFQLFDLRKRFAWATDSGGTAAPSPRITVVGFDPRIPLLRAAPAAATPPPDGGIPARGLSRRLAAISAALADLPKQARRLARWRARRLALTHPRFREPLRPGRPPGLGPAAGNEVHEILHECHALVRDRSRPDTS